MDMIINVKVNVVARRVHVNSFKDTQETLKQAMYLSKFKVYIESGIDIYYQDTTDFASGMLPTPIDLIIPSSSM